MMKDEFKMSVRVSKERKKEREQIGTGEERKKERKKEKIFSQKRSK